MSSSSNLDQFLASQAAVLGETPRLMAYARVVGGPPGPDLVYVFVGDRAAYLTSARGTPTLFGLPVPSKGQLPSPAPLALPRGEVLFGCERPVGFLRRLMATPNILELQHRPTARVWRLQLFQPAEQFASQWTAAWASE